MEKKYSSSDILVCGECKGQGYKTVGTGTYDSHHGIFENYEDQKCTLCKGSGMVLVVKLTTVTILPHFPKCAN